MSEKVEVPKSARTAWTVESKHGSILCADGEWRKPRFVGPGAHAAKVYRSGRAAESIAAQYGARVIPISIPANFKQDEILPGLAPRSELWSIWRDFTAGTTKSWRMRTPLGVMPFKTKKAALLAKGEYERVAAQRSAVPEAKPIENGIQAFFHCAQCLREKPEGQSPRQWVRIEVGWTKKGLQVWCVRHERNVADMDFMGQKIKLEDR